LAELAKDRDPKYSQQCSEHASKLKENILRFLWDEENQKFIPHIYLDKGSPFEFSINE